MADIDLNLYLRNEQFIKALKEAGVEWDKYSADRKLNDAEQIASQDKLIAKIDQLKKKQQELWDQYKKSGWQTKPKGLVETTRAIEDNEKALGDLTDAQKDAEKQTEETTQATTKGEKATRTYASTARQASLILIAMAAAGKLLTAILDAGKTSSDRLARGWSALKFTGEALLKTINSGDWSNFFKKMKEASDIGRQFAMSQEINAAKTLSTNKAIDEINVSISYYKKLIDDVTTSETDRVKYQKIIYELEKERAANSTALAESQLNSSLAVLKISKDELEQMLALAPAYEENAAKLQAFNKERKNFPLTVPSADIKDLVPGYERYAKVQGEAFNAAAAALSNYQQTIIGGNALIDQAAQDQAEKDKKAKEDALKRQEEFNKAIQKLLTDFEKAQVEGFTGKERIIAERNIQLAELAELEKYLTERGKLTEDAINQLTFLRSKYYSDAELALTEYDIKELQERQKTAKKVEEAAKENAASLLNIQRETQELALELIGDNEKAKQNLQIKFLEEDRTAISKKILNNEGTEAELKELTALYTLYGIKINILLKKQSEEAKGFSLTKALGLTEEEGEKLNEGLQFIVENISSALTDITDARVEEAAKNVSLIEDQITQTRAALDQELELAKQGFANNVSAKQQELAELEKARKKALEDQKKALKAQQQVDTVIQTISLITSAAQVFKDFSKIPVVGVPLAIAMIATMFAAFAAAKVKAAAAAKLAEGGTGTDTGIISGKRHSEGGEPFLNHVEVERGEMWGVLNRNASQKYGKQFNQVVTSFNKDKMPVMQPAIAENNILVDVNQTNERLDKVEYQLIKLNKHFGKTKEVSETRDIRIERTGNKTRIIRKNV